MRTSIVPVLFLFASTLQRSTSNCDSITPPHRLHENCPGAVSPQRSSLLSPWPGVDSNKLLPTAAATAVPCNAMIVPSLTYFFPRLCDLRPLNCTQQTVSRLVLIPQSTNIYSKPARRVLPVPGELWPIVSLSLSSTITPLTDGGGNIVGTTWPVGDPLSCARLAVTMPPRIAPAG